MPAAFVTGGAQGIGRGCAMALAAEGYSVLVCDLERQRVGGEATAAAVKASAAAVSSGGSAQFVACDVTDTESLAAAIASCAELFGEEISASVAVVGGGPDGARAPLLEQSAASYFGTIALTQHATFFQTQYSAQAMVRGGKGGSIVIIGSIMADMAAPTGGAYSMAKCAIRQLGKTAAAELAPHKIRVNVVQPGYIDTPGERQVRERCLLFGCAVLLLFVLRLIRETPLVQVASEEEIKNSSMCIPLQRMGTPEDIGNMVAFLCLPKASYVTGSVRLHVARPAVIPLEVRIF